MKAILTLAQTANAKNYEYTAEEAQACFAAIEEAARELYEAFGLGGGTELPEDTLKASSLHANSDLVNSEDLRNLKMSCPRP